MSFMGSVCQRRWCPLWRTAVAEEDGLGEGTSVVEAVGGLLGGEDAVEPAMEVVEVFGGLV